MFSIFICDIFLSVTQAALLISKIYLSTINKKFSTKSRQNNNFLQKFLTFTYPKTHRCCKYPIPTQLISKKITTENYKVNEISFFIIYPGGLSASHLFNLHLTYRNRCFFGRLTEGHQEHMIVLIIFKKFFAPFIFLIFVLRLLTSCTGLGDASIFLW